ncbi:MAG: hypothetical protein KJO55_00115, partial [Gammaproteobacteria bacterium]|nr:hypothetical protein [Gammaproteobacteria bacterium]
MNEQATPATPERDQQFFELREIIATLQDQWRWVAFITVSVAALALFYAIVTTPVYRSNALIQVEEKSSGFNGIVELTTVLTGETPTEAEIEIVRSRTVLGEAIAQQKLDLIARPLHFPLVGHVIAKRRDGPQPAAAVPGLGHYAWGGERIRVDRLDVPRALEGERLILEAGKDNRYSLSYRDEPVLEGEVGTAASGRGVSLFVSELVARPGTRFELIRRNWLDALTQLNNSLSVAERGKQTGILELTLEGESPELIADTLNSIATIYLRQNVERTSEDAAKTLAFLDSQLPELKNQLDTAEAALNQYRIQQGTIDLSLETQGLLEQLGEVDARISELQLQQAELSQRFTAEHPVRVALTDQLAELESTRAGIEQQIRRLPAAEQDSVR